MKSAIISTCKGRLAHADQSIPRFINQETEHSYKVYVVDFACPEKTFQYVDELSKAYGHNVITCIEVENNTQYFHLARARNIGGLAAINAGAEILCFADIDHLLPSDFLQKYISKMQDEKLDLCNANFDIRVPKLWDLEFFGLACIRSDCFLKMRGFDELFTGWGGDDVDLYARVRAAGYKTSYLSVGDPKVEIIYHSEEDSMRYHELDSMKESLDKNRLLMRDFATRIVNPGKWGEV